jgi:hypothetical protein
MFGFQKLTLVRVAVFLCVVVSCNCSAYHILYVYFVLKTLDYTFSCYNSIKFVSVYTGSTRVSDMDFRSIRKPVPRICCEMLFFYT